MPGRSHIKYAHVYVDGYDLTGYSRTFGPLTTVIDEADSTTLADAIKNALPNQSAINIGSINAVMDNTATVASLDRLNATATRTVLITIGDRTTPAQGVPAFMGTFLQSEPMASIDSGSAIMINAKFAGWDEAATSQLYGKAWGWLLSPKAVKTAVNSAAGIDDNGAATTAGGYMVYHLFSSNGTVNLKTQHAAVNTDVSFSDLLTTGLITAAVTPASGIVALAPTASVSRYLRWQIALGTATTCTIAIAFVRG